MNPMRAFLSRWFVKQWKFWLGVVISGLFLYVAVRDLQWQDFWAALRSAHYGWIIPGVAVYFVGVWVRAWRWHYLLRPLKSISTWKMFPIVTIGYAGNNIFPARAGEVVRAVILKRREAVPISASLATIIVERVFDGVVMLAFIFVNLAELTGLTQVPIEVGKWKISIQDVAIWGSVAFFGALGIFLLAAMLPRATEKLILWFTNHYIPRRWRAKVQGISLRFLGGLESLRSPLDVLMVFLTSVLIWLLETWKYWFVMHAFRFRVSFFALMLLNGIANLATTIPSAPGYLGVWEAVTKAVLMAYRVEGAEALGYAVVLHVALWLPITLLGVYYLAREGIRWGEDIRWREEVKKAKGEA